MSTDIDRGVHINPNLGNTLAASKTRAANGVRPNLTILPCLPQPGQLFGCSEPTPLGFLLILFGLVMLAAGGVGR